jgi:hypothetical protein
MKHLKMETGATPVLRTLVADLGSFATAWIRLRQFCQPEKLLQKGKQAGRF